MPAGQKFPECQVIDDIHQNDQPCAVSGIDDIGRKYRGRAHDKQRGKLIGDSHSDANQYILEAHGGAIPEK